MKTPSHIIRSASGCLPTPKRSDGEVSILGVVGSILLPFILWGLSVRRKLYSGFLSIVSGWKSLGCSIG